MEPTGMPPEAAAAAAVSGVMMIINLVMIVIMIISMWKIFSKAGKPGWAAIVPIYNLIVFLEVAGKPLWWIVMFFIPLVNIVFSIMALAALFKNFGKGAGWVVGAIFLPFIFYPMLAFGSAEYEPVEA
jgi:hypothetical protein